MTRASDIKSSLQVTARRVLDREATHATTEQPALAAGRACEKLALHFANLVGSAGIQALFDRSIALARFEHPWLAVAAAPTESRWTRLQTCLDAQGPAVANDAAVDLVATLLALIGRFIGDELVTQLLNEIYPDVT